MSKINLISSVHYCSTILYRNAVMNRKEQHNNEAALASTNLALTVFSSAVVLS